MQLTRHKAQGTSHLTTDAIYIYILNTTFNVHSILHESEPLLTGARKIAEFGEGNMVIYSLYIVEK